ncbi:hypothetical protein IKE72_02130 [Candidatus Saccharibacteria bacterium]|nr:hypothetical protein [Candidatus Saccharibacteria bacterium]
MKNRLMMAVILMGLLVGGASARATDEPAGEKAPTTEAGPAEGEKSPLTDAQRAHIVENCGEIRTKLKELQKADSRVRVHLGDAYDHILGNYVTPLNVRLVENNLSGATLIENQNSLVDMRAIFTSDFISYQQKLEELTTMNCAATPENFYDTLTVVRARREIMQQDAMRLRGLVSEHIKLVGNLRGEL